MGLSAEHIALFDAYIRNELSAQERLNFEEKLNNDNAFKQDFEAFKSFEQDMFDAEVIAFKDKLDEWDKSAKENTKEKTRIIPIRLIGLAASIAIIVTFSILYFIGQPSHQDLVATNFQPYDNILTVRGEKEDLDEGLMRYEAKEYQAAIALFERYPDNINAQFYSGEAYLALNDYEAAINVYKRVLQTDGIFNEVSEFHLALAYLGNNNTQLAKETLLAIQKESDYFINAEELLVELE